MRLKNLSGSDDLISLRMRGNTDRPFTVVQAMQAEAELKFRETLLNLQSRLQACRTADRPACQQGGSGTGTALTPEQSADIDKARHDIAGTRAELRDVQHNLRGDIDALGTVLAFLNISFDAVAGGGVRNRLRHHTPWSRQRRANIECPQARQSRSGVMEFRRRNLLILGSAAVISLALAAFALEQARSTGGAQIYPHGIFPRLCRQCEKCRADSYRQP